MVATFFVKRVSEMIRAGERTLLTPFVNKGIKFHDGNFFAFSDIGRFLNTALNGCRILFAYLH